MDRQSNKILSFNSLSIGYVSGRNKKTLLPPLNASAAEGELISVIGRNGIGKSTLLRTLTGLQKPLGGEILFNGRKIEEHSRMELAHKVSYISTEVVKAMNMSVYDLVALGRFPYTNWIGKIESKDQSAIMDALKQTSMLDYRNRFISELSDGERQKAMIARILAQDTGIMIMDEPTAFLDVAGRFGIFHLMNMLSSGSAKTIIFSTHDLQMATGYSDKIWVIGNDGLVEGSPEDLMINGAFDHLFDSDSIMFDSYDGTFSFRNKPGISIFIEGKGKRRHWTEKAVKRAGFAISKEKTLPYILIPPDKNTIWQLHTETSVTEFETIYDLINTLKKGINLS